MSEKTPLDIRLASCLPDLPNAGAIATIRMQEAGISQKRKLPAKPVPMIGPRSPCVEQTAAVNKSLFEDFLQRSKIT
jgi:hypothetical protein